MIRLFFDSTRFERVEWQQAFAEISDQYVFCDQAEEADYVLLWRPQRWDWQNLTQLKAVFCLGAGVDQHTELLLPPNCPLLRLADAGMAKSMVEYTHAVYLYYKLNFDHYLSQQIEHRWQAQSTRENARWRVGVLGLGPLGQAIAQHFQQQGTDTAAWSRSAKQLDGITCFSGMEQLDTLLARSDLLINVLPLNDDTAQLMNAQRLAALPREAVVVNVSRGAIFDEHALLEAINAEHLRGAWLDVTSTEPLPANHPLWAHPKVHITPHISAPTNIHGAAQQIVQTLQTEQPFPESMMVRA